MLFSLSSLSLANMQVNIHEAKTTLSALIQKALAGEEVIIAKAGEPLVHLAPIRSTEQPKLRPYGQWAGKGWVADDFNETDPEFLKYFE